MEFLPEGTITQEIRGSEDFVTGGDGFASTLGYSIFKNNFPTVQSESPMYRLQYGANDYNAGLLLEAPSQLQMILMIS
ncbi:hypothetical protein OWR28_12765 [Chryseobacterium sp. 1B4]